MVNIENNYGSIFSKVSAHEIEPYDVEPSSLDYIIEELHCNSSLYRLQDCAYNDAQTCYDGSWIYSAVGNRIFIECDNSSIIDNSGNLVYYTIPPICGSFFFKYNV